MSDLAMNNLMEMTYGEAIRQSLDLALSRDPNVYLLGEDIAEFGGVFGVTRGLAEKYGKDRIKNTPLSENAILGEAIGSALYGLKPIPEIQFSDFITTAMVPLVDVMANYHYRNNTSLPITIRMPSGGGLRIGNFHSKCLEAWFMHVPGLKIVIPSSPEDAKGLLLASLRDPNPVLFMEQKKLYYSVKQKISPNYYEIPLGKAKLVTEGKDLSLFTYGSMLHLALPIVKKFEEQGVSIELVDLRSLMPLDYDAMAQSVQKTGRALVLHEAVMMAGPGAEIAAWISEHCFESLKAPVLRLGSEYTPIPVAPCLEDAYLPNEKKLVAMIESLFA